MSLHSKLLRFTLAGDKSAWWKVEPPFHIKVKYPTSGVQALVKMENSWLLLQMILS